MPNPIGSTTGPAFATPVYIAPAPGSMSANITTAATTEIKDAPGVVTAITVNTGVAGKTIKLYDGDPGAAGVLLGTYSAAAAINLPLGAGGLTFADSLWAVTDGTADITVSYY